MYRIGRYTPGDGMSELINDNYHILLVMSRFGIGLGFGDRTIGEVCSDNGVDTATFLAIVNMLLDRENAADSSGQGIEISSMLAYLHNSHDYFLDFRLPAIRKQLEALLADPKDELSRAIIKYFDEYAAEVRKHMTYEEVTVFPYVKRLLAGGSTEGYDIGIFSRQHDQVEARLTEFKQILIKYYPAASTNEMNSLLFDIFNCENDLASHSAIEDRLFVPAIIALEHKSKTRP